MATRLERYSQHFLMTTRTTCCYLHGKRVGEFGGRPLGTVLSALSDDDTHDVLLFTRKNVGESGGGPFGTVLSAVFDDDTHDVLLFARKTPETNSGRPVWHGTLCIF